MFGDAILRRGEGGNELFVSWLMPSCKILFFQYTQPLFPPPSKKKQCNRSPLGTTKSWLHLFLFVFLGLGLCFLMKQTDQKQINEPGHWFKFHDLLLLQAIPIPVDTRQIGVDSFKRHPCIMVCMLGLFLLGIRVDRVGVAGCKTVFDGFSRTKNVHFSSDYYIIFHKHYLLQAPLPRIQYCWVLCHWRYIPAVVLRWFDIHGTIFIHTIAGLSVDGDVQLLKEVVVLFQCSFLVSCFRLSVG